MKSHNRKPFLESPKLNSLCHQATNQYRNQTQIKCHSAKFYTFTRMSSHDSVTKAWILFIRVTQGRFLLKYERFTGSATKDVQLKCSSTCEKLTTKAYWWRQSNHLEIFGEIEPLIMGVWILWILFCISSKGTTKELKRARSISAPPP